MKLTAEIIAIGTEILLGDIVNTNAQVIARGLSEIGIDTYRQQVVGDNPKRLTEVLKEAYSRANLVITSGGLGPTEDDLSKETAAAFMGAELVMDETARGHIEEYMLRRGRTITDNNWKQALLPVGARAFYNPNGTAPGFALEKDERILIMLPGPPSELVGMFRNQVLPYLQKKTDSVMVSRTLHLCGKGESEVESILYEDMISMQNPTLSPYAKEGIVDLRITAKGADEAACREMIRPVEEKIRGIFGSVVFGADGDSLESVVISLLKEKGLKIATCESMTAGMIAARLANISGASDVLKGGFVTYTNEMKETFPEVKHETIETYGVVSEEVAGEMARGTALKCGTEVAVSVTGLAGPTGGSEKTPVGTVCVGVYLLGQTTTRTFHLMRLRNSNRELATVRALNLVRETVQSLSR